LIRTVPGGETRPALSRLVFRGRSAA